jgi:hypothetical protein
MDAFASTNAKNIGVLRRGLLLQSTADFDIYRYGSTVSLNILVCTFELLVGMNCCIAICLGLLYSGNKVKGVYWNQRVRRSH